jgi:hypothetical protein
MAPWTTHDIPGPRRSHRGGDRRQQRPGLRDGIGPGPGRRLGSSWPVATRPRGPTPSTASAARSRGPSSASAPSTWPTWRRSESSPPTSGPTTRPWTSWSTTPGSWASPAGRRPTASRCSSAPTTSATSLSPACSSTGCSPDPVPESSPSAASWPGSDVSVSTISAVPATTASGPPTPGQAGQPVVHPRTRPPRTTAGASTSSVSPAHPGYAATNLQAVGPQMSGSNAMEARRSGQLRHGPVGRRRRPP